MDGGKSMCKKREVRNGMVVSGNCKYFVARVRLNNKDSPLIYELGLSEKRHAINSCVNKQNGIALY